VTSFSKDLNGSLRGALRGLGRCRREPARFSFLNWIVDGPGWLVSRFTSIDFHEGEGAFGFLLAIFLAWLMCSTVAWLVIYSLQTMANRKIKEDERI
jgi:hypothetical protein